VLGVFFICLNEPHALDLIISFKRVCCGNSIEYLTFVFHDRQILGLTRFTHAFKGTWSVTAQSHVLYHREKKNYKQYRVKIPVIRSHFA